MSFAGSQARWDRLKKGTGNDILEDVKITCLGEDEDLPEPEEKLVNDLVRGNTAKEENAAAGGAAEETVPKAEVPAETPKPAAATPSQLARPAEKATSSQLTKREQPES